MLHCYVYLWGLAMSKQSRSLKRWHRTTGVLLLTVSLILAGCDRTKEIEYSLEHHDYYFPPQREMEIDTLMRSLTNQAQSESKPVPIAWSQKQFFDLIEALVKDQLKQGAELQSVFFNASCKDVDFGPQTVSVDFWRIAPYQGQPMRLRIAVDVEAQVGHISVRLIGYSPPQVPITEIGPVDVINSKIPIEKILMLAEQAGGRALRESISNNCRVGGVLAENKWRIFYDSLVSHESLLILDVDADTGQITEVRGWTAPSPK